MKYSEIFEKRINCSNSTEVFNHLIQTLQKTITKWDYFVNWAKVFKNIETLEVDLNILNYLVGRDNIKEEFAKLLRQYPSLYVTIPILIACRQNTFEILNEYESGALNTQAFSFKKKLQLDESEITEAVEFASSVGFLDLLKNKKIKNVVDYVIGVEVGLDSNGRKNRGGTMMEEIVEFHIKKICQKNNFEYIAQATSSQVKSRWKQNLTVDKSSRRIDFAVFNGNQLYLIETNFYGGGGSKLKATAGEYKTMGDYWNNDGHRFIWITDGAGWHTTKRPLEETFNYIDYILNLEMISKKLLEDIIVRNL